jgi:uncharacterized protein YndB with AHSA1/START domain
MKPPGGGNDTKVARLIDAPRERIYRALTDPEALVAWLPPGTMRGVMHAFEARVGGGYRMSLFYPDDESAARGKTSEREDRVNVRFVELTPPARIVEAVTFDTAQAAFRGEMTIIWTLAADGGGTQVAVACRNLPPGIRPEDNETGSRQSLEQLARYVEDESRMRD